MELAMKTLGFLTVFLVSTCCIYGVPVTNETGTTKTSLLQDLDPANLQSKYIYIYIFVTCFTSCFFKSQKLL